MIEYCSSRSMLLVLIFFCGLTFLEIVLEESVSQDALNPTERKEEVLAQIENQYQCWMEEGYDELDDCQLCSAMERLHDARLICSYNGYRQRVQCLYSGEVYRTCEVYVLEEERMFWMFESFVAFIGVLAGLNTALQRHRMSLHSKKTQALAPPV